jgi:formyltetrahydrofolate-dependent phosphoribosylglycinamide formyltransferase
VGRQRIAVFASGAGSTFAALVRAGRAGEIPADVVLLIASRETVPALAIADELSVESVVLDQTLTGADRCDAAMVDALMHRGIDLVVLAGYLRKIGPRTLEGFAGRIVNTHPAPLTKFGGRGMYGRHVHPAVLDAGEQMSAASVHLVDAEYDTGPVIAQRQVPVFPDDTVDALQARVQTVERSLLLAAITELSSSGCVPERPAKISGRQVVLFDIFGTLVPGGSTEERDAVSRLIANDLGVDPEEFALLMRATFDERMRGTLGDLRDTLAQLANRLGADPSRESLEVAAQRRLLLTRQLHSQTWAIPALEALTAVGVRVAVVSDCSAETPEVWPESPIAPYVQATSFSCVTGIRKPAPEAYLVAIRALNAERTDCVFVGDGGSNELNGAEALGMTAYRFAPENRPGGQAVDPAPDWYGPEIKDLAELTGILEA